MAKTVNFEYEGTQFRLGFNRETVAVTEERGFHLNEAENTPINSMKELFKGSFIMNHPKTRSKLIDDIWDALPNKGDLLNVLVEAYADAYNALYAEPSEEKKVVWTVEG